MYNIPKIKTKLTLLHLIQYNCNKNNRLKSIDINKKDLAELGGYAKDCVSLNRQLQELVNENRIKITKNDTKQDYHIKVVKPLSFTERKDLGVKAFGTNHTKEFYYLLALFALEKRQKNGIIKFSSDKGNFLKENNITTRAYYNAEKQLMLDNRLVNTLYTGHKQEYKLMKGLTNDEINKFKYMVQHDEYYKDIYDELSNVQAIDNKSSNDNLEEQVEFAMNNSIEEKSSNKNIINKVPSDEVTISDIDKIIDDLKIECNKLINNGSTNVNMLIDKINKLTKENEQLRNEIVSLKATRETHKLRLLQIYKNLLKGDQQWERK